VSFFDLQFLAAAAKKVSMQHCILVTSSLAIIDNFILTVTIVHRAPCCATASLHHHPPSLSPLMLFAANEQNGKAGTRSFCVCGDSACHF
jgi:hypothetical protein